MSKITDLFGDSLDKQLFGTKLSYLDDLDLDQMTDEQRAAFKEMLEKDPYRFYSLWRDPDAAQRRYEGDDFQTVPASEMFIRIGALKAAGAPDNVIDFWQRMLETSGRDNDIFVKAKQPKTKPVKAKLAQVEAFCRYLEEYWNIEDRGPAIADLNNPYADHWADVMNEALGIKDDTPLHGVDVKHYRDTQDGMAASGCEVVEAVYYVPHISFDLQEMSEVAQCGDIKVFHDGHHFIAKFYFYGCYE
jgi:hypothetical protein